MMPGQPPPAQPAAQPFPASPPPQGNAQPPVTIDAVVKLLRDDRMRGFRIDIETDGLVESDQKQERADATELVTAIGGFFKEFGPIVQAMPPLAPLASGLLQFAVRRYHVGAELEELIEKTMGDVAQHLANPPPPQPDPTEQVKLQIAQTKAQAEGQKSQANIQATGMKAQAEGQKAQIGVQQAQVDAHGKAISQQLDLAGKVMDHHATVAEHHLTAQQMDRQAAADQRAHDLKIEQMNHAAAQAKKPKGG
jgi:hypothetical protein